MQILVIRFSKRAQEMKLFPEHAKVAPKLRTTDKSQAGRLKTYEINLE